MHILNNYHSHNRPLLSPNYALLADQLWQLHFFRHSRWPQDGLSWILDFPLKFDQCREQLCFDTKEKYSIFTRRYENST